MRVHYEILSKITVVSAEIHKFAKGHFQFWENASNGLQIRIEQWNSPKLLLSMISLFDEEQVILEFWRVFLIGLTLIRKTRVYFVEWYLRSMSNLLGLV